MAREFQGTRDPSWPEWWRADCIIHGKNWSSSSGSDIPAPSALFVSLLSACWTMTVDNKIAHVPCIHTPPPPKCFCHVPQSSNPDSASDISMAHHRYPLLRAFWIRFCPAPSLASLCRLSPHSHTRSDPWALNMPAPQRPRQPKLRQSCDGCFLAKVKCSKQRPICTRCLAVGLECRYSPSSRAGKTPRSDSHTATSRPHELNVCLPDPGLAMYVPVQQPASSAYLLDATWKSQSHPIEGITGSQPIPLNLSIMAIDGQDHTEQKTAPLSDMFNQPISWTPSQTEILPGHYPEAAVNVSMPHQARSRSFDVTNGDAAPLSPWTGGPSHVGGLPYPSATAAGAATITSSLDSPAVYYPSPMRTPSQFRPASVQSHPRRSSSRDTCRCFAMCLESLQTLHNASSPACPPLDEVLLLNRRAVDGCAAMLACQRCMRRSGMHTATMLLSAVMSQVNSVYRAASRSHFESATADCTPAGSTPASTSTAPTSPPTASASPDDGAVGLGLSLGSYRVASRDSRWFELEILSRELRKLEEVYARFRDVCCSSDLAAEDPAQDVGQAMIGYLERHLRDTLAAISLSRSDLGYL